MKKQVFAYLHTHWDREWYRDREDFNIRLLDVVDSVIDELLNNRAPFFYLDGQTGLVFDYLKYRENKKTTMEKRTSFRIGDGLVLFKKGRSLSNRPCILLSRITIKGLLTMKPKLRLSLGYFSWMMLPWSLTIMR